MLKRVKAGLQRVSLFQPDGASLDPALQAAYLKDLLTKATRLAWKSASRATAASLLSVAPTCSTWGPAYAANAPQSNGLDFTLPTFAQPTASATSGIAPVSNASQPYLFNLQTPEVSDVGHELAKKGIYAVGFDDFIFNDVPAGGIKHGAFMTNRALIGVNIDMNQLAGIYGAQLHFAVNDIGGYGHNYKYTGADYSYLENWGNHDGLQLREFTWDQSLLNDRVFVLAGRLGPKSGEYDGSELYCLFVSFMCSTPTQYGVTSSSPSFVTSTWGTRLLVKPTKNTYAKIGVWEDEPLLKQPDQGGFPGKDWDFNQGSGVFVPAEIGYVTTFADDRYPRHYDIGFTYDTTKYSDPYLNGQGLPTSLYGGSANSERGRAQVFLQGQQMVWRPDPADTRGLYLFSTLNALTYGDAPMQTSVVFGLFDWGPFASRPKDYFGLVFENFWYDWKYTSAVDALLSKDGNVQKISKTMSMAEVNYAFNIAPGVKFIPYLEYIWNPDLQADPNPVGNVKYAIQTGFRVTFLLNDALDLPSLNRVRN